MRVGVVAWEFPPKHSGGLGIHLHGLINSLKKMVDMVVFMPERNAPETITGVQLVKFRSSKEGMEFVNDINDQILEAACTMGLDLLHCQDWVSFPVAKRMKHDWLCPVVCSIHSTEHDRSGRLLKGESGVLKLERTTLSEADAVITVSDYMKKRLVKLLGIDENKIFSIPNGIDHSKISPSPSEGKNILYLGRLTEQKGVEYLLYAVKDLDATLTVLGGGHLEESLKKFASIIGARAVFKGFTNDREAIAEEIRRATMVVMPSVSEPFGIVALEAMAAKKPVIISKYSGVRDFVSHGKHCLIVDPFKPEQIVGAIKKLQDPDLRKKLVDNAYELLEQGVFSWERIAERTLTVYTSTLINFFSSSFKTSSS